MVIINIQKKDLWLLSAIVVFLVGVGFVIAIGSGDYTTHGHDIGEIEGGGATYISSWQSISTGGSVTFDHNLGTDQLTTTLHFKPTLTGPISDQYTTHFGGAGYGVGIYEVTSSQIKVSGGTGGLLYWGSAGHHESATSGYVRVIVTVA